MVARPRERGWHLVLGYVALLTAVVMAAVPAYLFVESRWQPLVVRLAAALVLGVMLIHVRRIVSRRVDADGVSAFDAALEPAAVPPRVEHRLVDLEEEVRAAVRSRRSFERTLWPRLLAHARGPIAAPARRRFARGPSVDELRTLVERLERQP
jgi:type VI protein secretion system component VasK